MAACFAFDGFVLDTQERRLIAGDGAVELNARYFDALALLVGSQGQLVHKDRFMAEVWRGVPVTDEALTQCIRTLRRQLGDEAGRPRFIETVPKHGYRFIAPVELLDAATPPSATDIERWRRFLIVGSAGTFGGAIAGVIGGLIYGFAAASAGGGEAISVLLVLLSVSLLVAIIGAAGVSFAIATAAFAPARSRLWTILGGAAGGLIVGAFGKLLGLDAFALLFGHSPVAITGAMEGLLLGAAVGAGAWLSERSRSTGKSAALAGFFGGAAGLLIVLLGGRLMLGSLAALTRDFPRSQLRIDHISRLFGDPGFGPVTQFVSAALEGALFSACIVGAMAIVRRKLPSEHQWGVLIRSE
ncbi:MAG: winged helix-turn-helix domain-containing protein [Sphingomicrobium sp.]